MALEKKQQQATEWVNEYADMLYNYALQRIKDTDTAKDLVQDTFLAAWRNIDNYTGEASVKTWLFAILKNKLIDYYRKAASTYTTASIGDKQENDIFFNDVAHWSKEAYPVEWSVKSDSYLESKEFYAILGKCKKKLKEIQMAVFTLKYLENQDSEEICKTLNITTANYWVLIHRAKLQMRACIEKNWFIH